jgi:hypothetical protein
MPQRGNFSLKSRISTILRRVTMSKAWSNKDIETLRALAQRQKAIQIAKELGRSYGATVVKAHQLGISLKFQPEHATRTDPLDESATN